MAKYFFDTQDGAGLIRDEDGSEQPDDEAARRAGLDALPDMARDEIPDGDRRTFDVIVRNADGHAIYAASLSLSGMWLK